MSNPPSGSFYGFGYPVDVASQMWNQNLQHEQDLSTLRLKAAKSSEDVLATYLGGIREHLEVSIGGINNKLDDWNRRFAELSEQQDKPTLTNVLGNEHSNAGPFPKEQPEELKQPHSFVQTDSPSSSSSDDSDSVKDELQLTSEMDAVCSSPDPKMEPAEQAMPDPKMEPAERAVPDPIVIPDWLQSSLDRLKLMNMFKEFNAIRFDPKCETAIAFLKRFEDLRRKLACEDPDLLSPTYVKHIFQTAIDTTLTYQQAKLHDFKYSIAEMLDMLTEEQLNPEQAIFSGSSLSENCATSSRGPAGVKGRVPILKSSFPLSKASKAIKKTFCAYCKTRGHSIEVCYKRNKTCSNCHSSNEHSSADCPFPKKVKDSTSNQPQPPLKPAKTLKKRTFCAFCKIGGHCVEDCYKRNKTCYNCHSSNDHNSANCPLKTKKIEDSASIQPQSPTGTSKLSDENSFCIYCKKPGHSIKVCFKAKKLNSDVQSAGDSPSAKKATDSASILPQSPLKRFKSRSLDMKAYCFYCKKRGHSLKNCFKCPISGEQFHADCPFPMTVTDSASLQPQPPLEPTKEVKKTFCIYCKTRGHLVEDCYKRNKTCFNCHSSNEHVSADCPFPRRVTDSSIIQPQPPLEPTMEIKKTFCIYCKTRGHLVEDCYKRNKTCFNCHSSNEHVSADCPFPRRVTDSSIIQPQPPLEPAKAPKRRLFCVFCKIGGHSIENCFKRNKTCSNCHSSNEHLSADCPFPMGYWITCKRVTDSSSIQLQPPLEHAKAPKRRLFCVFCKTSGHFIDECYKRNKTCYNCHQSNEHLSADCPLKIKKVEDSASIPSPSAQNGLEPTSLPSMSCKS